MLTYVEYINRFWKECREDFIGSHHGIVYFYLLSVNNSLGWKETFKHTDRLIAARLKMSEKTVQRAKKKLSKMGLIKYTVLRKKEQGLNACTIYSFDVENDFLTESKSVSKSVSKSNDLDMDLGGTFNPTEDVQSSALNRYIDIDIDKEYIKKEDKSSKKAKSKKSIENAENETTEKSSGEKKIFRKPTVEEIQEFLNERGGPPIDAEYFFNHYEANGWIVGKAKMKDWKATVRNWQKRDFTHAPTAKEVKRLNHPMTNYSGQKTNADDRF